MFRVRSVAALASAAVVSLLFVALQSSDAEARKIRLPLTSVASGAYVASSVSKANALATRTADAELSKAEIARQRADKALRDSGETDKVEDEEVMSKAVPDDEALAAKNSSQGEPVVVKPTNKIVCIANCN